MDKLRSQVRKAHRRLLFEQFLRTLTSCLFVVLAVAAVAVALPKFVYLGVGTAVWTWSWLGGGAVLAAVIAVTMTYLRRRTLLDAAIEVDLRFGLKERIASSLSLSEADTEAGRALLRDALRSAEKLNVVERFPVRLHRRAWLPLVPAVIAFCLVTFLDNKGADRTASATTTAQAQSVQVKTAARKLTKPIDELRKKAEEQGRTEAGELFKQLEEGTKDLAEKKDVDRKEALVKLNDLSEQIEQRRNSLGGDNEIKQHLNQLNKMGEGPAQDLAKALEQGDFQKAAEELKKLGQKIASSELSEADKEKLAQQMEQMKEKLQEMAAAHQQAAKSLQEQIERERQAGNTQKAAELQKQLDKLAQQKPQMEQLQKLAAQLGECSNCIGQGDGEGAAAALGQLAADLEGMQEQLEEMEMLEEALEQIAMAKQAMGCAQCNGMGCAACNGMGMFGGQGGGEGGLKPGTSPGGGFADEPIDPLEANSYDSQVRQQPGRGRAVITDLVDGPNIKGAVLEEIKSEITAGARAADDPLTTERLPRGHREHAKEFFENFREGD